MNIAARIVTKTPRRSHISPILYKLHWLSVNKRVEYKIMLLVFRAYHRIAPDYLNELAVKYIPARPLRSKDSKALVVPKVNSKRYGQRAFGYAGPQLWNSLPAELKTITSYGCFKVRLKTYLFEQLLSDISV